MPLIATAGAADANSYLTVSEADKYFETRLHADLWQTSDDQEAALIWATRLLDEMLSWAGIIATDTQALRWPRLYVKDEDDREFSSTAIPQWLKDATAEMAFHLLTSDRTAEPESSGIKEMKVGTLEIVFDKYSSLKMMPTSVAVIVRPYAFQRKTTRTLVRM